LWQVQDGGIERFRCRVGHAYSDEALFESQTDGVEEAVWTAVRSMSEHAELTERLAKRARERGDDAAAERLEQRQAQLRRAMDVIRGAIIDEQRSA
jgi:two-component system chemotaxis response regulator CheB